MESLLETIVEFFESERGTTVITAILVLFFGLIVVRLLRSAITRILARNMSVEHAAVVSRLAYSLMVAVVVLVSIKQLGVDLSVLLGAAGILTVALGFASQTSASNLISGIFLLGERPFVVGDIIKVGTTFGEVVSVDLLSVKLRTFDNLFVRVPNETLLKTEITTLTKYPIRRIDYVMSFDAETELEAVKEALIQVADSHPNCLDEPEPTLFFDRFENGLQHVKFVVWVQRELFIEVKNELPDRIRQAFARSDLHLALPRYLIQSAPTNEPSDFRVES